MRGRRFDLVVQVGDLGVLPDRKTGERPYDRFSEWDSSVYDLYDIVMATGERAQHLGRFREVIETPILVVAGNHDELSPILGAGESDPPAPTPIDPHGLFAWVPDAYTLDAHGALIGFCQGGDPRALAGSQPGQYDVLVSHEGGFGGAGGDQLSSGPEAMIQYLRRMKPRFHLFGHFHHALGPVRVHETQCVQLASVVSDPRHPTLPVINDGCIGALDTESGKFEFIGGGWVRDYERHGGLQLLAERFHKGTS